MLIALILQNFQQEIFIGEQAQHHDNPVVQGQCDMTDCDHGHIYLADMGSRCSVAFNPPLLVHAAAIDGIPPVS